MKLNIFKQFNLIFTPFTIQELWNNKIPFVFVTNGTYTYTKLLDKLKKILDLPLTQDHIIVSPTPCASLTEYHDKNVLVCCQADSLDMVKQLGFKSYVTIPQLVEIFPELDYVDHNKRESAVFNNQISLTKNDSFS